jgi:hypothetical protein
VRNVGSNPVRVMDVCHLSSVLFCPVMGRSPFQGVIAKCSEVFIVSVLSSDSEQAIGPSY